MEKIEKLLKENSKSQLFAKVVLVPVIITLSIATLTYLITMYTPALSFTQGVQGFRFAHGLKVFCLSTPFAGFGIALGNFYANVAVGKIMTSFHLIVTAHSIVFGYLVYRLAKLGKQQGLRYHAKNIVLLILLATIGTVLVRADNAILKYGIFTAVEAQKFFWTAMGAKCMSSIIATLAGYPLFMGFLIIKNSNK